MFISARGSGCVRFAILFAMKSPKLTAILAAVVLVVCAASPSGGGSPDNPGKRVPGTLAQYGEALQIIVPEAVERGEVFEVDVTIYGGGCVGEGDLEVEVEGLQATIRPYDYDVSVPGFGCTLELIIYRRTASLRFDAPGRAQVRVLGLKKGINDSHGKLITVTRNVEVR